MALTEATKEGIYLRSLLNELGITVQTIKLKCDNQGAQKLARNPTYHNRTKHIDIRFHFIREAIEKKEVDLEYIFTEEMPADIMTKALCKARHEKHIKNIGMVLCN